MSQLIFDKNKYSSETFADLDIPESKLVRKPKSVLNISHREKSIRVLGSVSKELSGKTFSRNLQNFKPSGGLHQKEIVCEPNSVSVRFSSPLDRITSPVYIKRWKCDELVSEGSSSSNSDQDKKRNSSVIAVKLNWRKGVKVEQVSNYSGRTKLIEPEMTTTDFDFESKIKFQKQFQSTCDELFPEKDLMILDGNECHGRAIKSKGVQQDLQADEQEDSPTTDLTTTSTFTDIEEHQILLVPFNSKSGFDNDVSKRYKFPYHAKFSIGKKTFEHKFELKLALSQAPQHFGLIFSFPDGDSRILNIKSLLTVFSVFPSTPRYASLSTYRSNPDDDDNENKNNSSTSSKSRSKKSFVKNLTGTISSNLTEDNAIANRMQNGSQFSIQCDIAHPNQRKSRGKNSLDEADDKHKIKQRLLLNIKADARE